MDRLQELCRSYLLSMKKVADKFGLGRKCFCFYIYIARVPKRRIKGYCYMANSENVVFNMKHNIDKFRFFGYMDIDNEDY